ncbi:hypothetical protein evm_002808 [Chilo suppressalis]|nr:hypothetical protein evm_002808 [Chilo suppressalis]
MNSQILLLLCVLGFVSSNVIVTAGTSDNIPAHLIEERTIKYEEIIPTELLTDERLILSTKEKGDLIDYIMKTNRGQLSPYFF